MTINKQPDLNNNRYQMERSEVVQGKKSSKKTKPNYADNEAEKKRNEWKNE